MNLKSVDTAALAAELARRQRAARTLAERRERLARELAEVDAELAALGQVAGPRRGRRSAAAEPERTPRRRAKNDVSLGDALVRALELRAIVTPAEAARKVKETGYRSTARNFGMMVSNALAKDERFKRVARGQYERVA